MSLLARLGVEHPVVQAGMGGGIAGHELAAAVSGAGGLGTIGMADPDRLAEEVRAARSLTSSPLAVNLLLPFARKGHWRVAADADLVVSFWGEPERRADVPWVHQCGSLEEVLQAREAGADGVIVQGVEAGGHVRGTEPALQLLARVRARVDDFPLWLAGGIATAADVRQALGAGAEAAVAGTRFLMSNESRAHPEYKQLLCVARETVLTELFGAGWADAPHRVLPNAATRRWGDGPRWVQAVNGVLRDIPESVARRASVLQRPRSPLLTPLPPVAGGPENLIESGPLYAGETVARIDDIRPAGELVAELSGTPRSP